MGYPKVRAIPRLGFHVTTDSLARWTGMSRWAASALLVIAGCSEPSYETKTAAPPPRTDAEAPRALAPLGGDWLEELRDANDKPAGAVAIPILAREKRPLVVAVHGAGSRPDGMCSAARAALGPWPFIVCPHPIAKLDRETSWSSPAQLRSAIDHAVAAAEARFSDYLDTREVLYLGHSQGAMMAPDALALPSTTVHFGSAIFFEGLPRDAARAKSELLGTGITRFLLASGQNGWAPGHEAFAKSFAGTPIEARHVHRTTGHFFNAQVSELIGKELPWVAHWRGAGAGGPEES